MQHQWDGKRLKGTKLAIDTETTVSASQLEIPTLVICTASDGERSVWFPPAQVDSFLRVHRGCTLYAYNAPFDFWVLNHRTLWDMTNEGKYICLQLLWRLIRLAEGGVAERSGTLADACEVYGANKVDKSDPYRMRYGELLDCQDYTEHPEWEGFRDYAIKDACSTWQLIAPMESQAACLQASVKKGIHPGAVKKWGLLSVGIQTRGACVLAHLSRQPLRVDVAKATAMEVQAREEIEAASMRLESLCPGIWHKFKKKNDAGYKKNASGMYQRNEKPLIDLLVNECREAGKLPPMTPSGDVSTSASAWGKHLPDSPFVQEWTKLELIKKRLTSFILPIVQSGGTIYARYEPLLNTGRTSASKYGDRGIPSINIQQIPKDNTIRELFLADDGTERITSDYAYLELRTLAACCHLLYGYSRLGDACRKHTADEDAGKPGLDPHEWMGAVSLGIPIDQWHSLDEATRKQARQKAKVANFGLPGGLGVKKLIEYAKGYKVNLTIEQAKELKATWFRAFPEMGQWLEDRTRENLAFNLQVPLSEVKKKFPHSWNVWNLRHAVEGILPTEEARPYIEGLYRMCRNTKLKAYLDSFDYLPPAHEELSEHLLLGRAAVPTGLIRGLVGYCDGCNLPFQGLAAAGAKEALWRLLYAGYIVKAFIHDEILVDSPLGSRLMPNIQRHMNQAMESVMLGDVPCRSTSHVEKTWVKR